MKTYRITRENAPEIVPAMVGFIAEMNQKLGEVQRLLDLETGEIPTIRESTGVCIIMLDNVDKREAHLSLTFNVDIKEVPYAEDRP